MNVCTAANECSEIVTGTEPLALLFQLRTVPLAQFRSSRFEPEAFDEVLKQWLVPVSTIVVLLLVSGVAIWNWLRDRKAPNEPVEQHSWPRAAGGATPRGAATQITDKFGLFDQSLILDKCDYVMVFPLRQSDSASEYMHTTGNSKMMLLQWDKEVDGLEMARKIFRDPCKEHLLEEDGLEECFSEKMTFEDYSSAVRGLLLKLLAGPKFGLDMETFPSYDLDEVFLTIRLPRKQDGLRQYAAHFSYSMPLNDLAYQQINEKVPCDFNGNKVRTYAHFIPDYQEYFKNFRQADKLRLLQAQMEKYINAEALRTQFVLADDFAAHYWKTVVDMSAEWGNPWCWYRMPNHLDEDKIRDYFGEEVAWIFVWQTKYARALLFPALLGVLVYLRRYFVHTAVSCVIQLSFAVVMATWAEVFNGSYLRYEARVQQRWGMHKYVPPIYVRDEYLPSLEGSWRVLGTKFVGDLLALMMIGLVMLGIFHIQSWQKYLIESNATWAMQKIPAVLVTIQILVIDNIWFKVSRYIVESENHKSRQHFLNAWASKLFFVRIINNLFPFIYKGFLEELHNKCPAGNERCHIDDLEVNLCVYFAAMITKMVLHEIFMVLFTRREIVRELHGEGLHKRDYSYLEVQAKSPEYSDRMQMNDWTESVIGFAFLACFNVVLPAIAPIALIACLVRQRCMAHRNISILRRPVPTGARGIGTWRTLCEMISVIAVVVNTAFAVFAMQPVRNFSSTTKWQIFMASQYAMFLVKVLIRDKFPAVPRDVEDLQRLNEETIRKVFLDKEAHCVDVQREEPCELDIGPRAFSKDTPHSIKSPQLIGADSITTVYQGSNDDCSYAEDHEVYTAVMQPGFTPSPVAKSPESAAH